MKLAWSRRFSDTCDSYVGPGEVQYSPLRQSYKAISEDDLLRKVLRDSRGH